MGADIVEENFQQRDTPFGERNLSSSGDRDLDSIEQTTPSAFVWLVASAAAIGWSCVKITTFQ